MISWQCVKSIMDKPPKKALDLLPFNQIDLTEFDSFLHAPMNVNYRSILSYFGMPAAFRVMV